MKTLVEKRLEYQGVKILLDNHVLYRIHGRLQQSGICGVRIMDINLTVRYPVDAPESIRKISGSRVEIRIRAGEIGKVFGYRRDSQFAFEQVDLVQEEDDGLALEPFAIGQGFKEHHCFVHLILYMLEDGFGRELPDTNSTLVFH